MRTLQIMVAFAVTFTLATATAHAITHYRVGTSLATAQHAIQATINSAVLAQYGRSFGDIVDGYIDERQKARKEKEMLNNVFIGLVITTCGLAIVGTVLKFACSKRCPYCQETIFSSAIVCKHCHRNLNARRSISTNWMESQPQIDTKPRRQINITFKCPHCGKSFSTALRGTGRIDSCPACHQRITTPASET